LDRTDFVSGPLHIKAASAGQLTIEINDIGVAGPQRLLAAAPQLRQAAVVVVVAGFKDGYVVGLISRQLEDAMMADVQSPCQPRLHNNAQ
jgi:NCAIR mutase (PurE)-related protein